MPGYLALKNVVQNIEHIESLPEQHIGWMSNQASFEDDKISTDYVKLENIMTKMTGDLEILKRHLTLSARPLSLPTTTSMWSSFASLSERDWSTPVSYTHLTLPTIYSV